MKRQTKEKGPSPYVYNLKLDLSRAGWSTEYPEKKNNSKSVGFYNCSFMILVWPIDKLTWV